MILPNGTLLGRYRIEKILGQGQAGVVYLAFDPAIERTIAIKCLKMAGREIDREREKQRIEVLLAEARVIGQLNHPHITAVFDMGTSGGVPYIVMEYVEGETLKSRLARMEADRASVPQILNFIVMVARALHYVHQRGILHGDIKPGNIIVTPQGTPKIMDFGIARRSPNGRPATWSLVGEELIWGTPGYVAPEQLEQNEIDARADVFSLGVIAYEWLSGRKPFQGDSEEETLKSVLHCRPKSLCEPGNFDPELSRDIDQALARNPAQRFVSADVMADALEICQERWLRQLPNFNPAETAENKRFESFPRLKGRNLLFAGFSEEELACVMQMSRRENYEEGNTILKEGAGGSTMYVVVRGRVSIRKLSGAREKEIKQLSTGECFGEMAVISQMPRSATVVALRATELLVISGAVLRSGSQVLAMKLYRNIASLLSERMRQRDEQVVSLLENEPESRPAKRRFPFW